MSVERVAPVLIQEQTLSSGARDASPAWDARGAEIRRDSAASILRPQNENALRFPATSHRPTKRERG